MTKSNSFSQLLNTFWLRPETALWRELDIRAMESFDFESPSLDIGCGDGLFSFIRAGGKLDAKFDKYRAMTQLNKFFNNVDVFDAFSEQAIPVVIEPPKYSIDCGFDHKKNLLKKAEQLGFYSSLTQGDANQRLPFQDNSFNSIFSNIIYWLDDPENALIEVSRILRAGGRACLMLPNSSFSKFSFYNQLYANTEDSRWDFLKKLDRGRFSEIYRQANSKEGWELMFKRAGLNVVEHHTHLSKTVIQIWDIGMRPLFPVLHRMTNLVPPENYLDIKNEWVATLRQFLEPLTEMDCDLNQGEEPAFHCFILEK